MVKYYTFNGMTIAMRRGGTLTYLHSDHLSSNTLVTNADGTVHSSQNYCAYGGKRTATWYGSLCDPTAANPLPTDRTYTGQEQDGTGLMYYRARYYDSSLGTFISPDTMVPEPGRVSDFNRFAYVRNNPLRYSDPSGHSACEEGDDRCWERRWYLAHGLMWGEGNWGKQIEARFFDADILNEVLKEAGIGAAGSWIFAELSLLGQGVVALANKIGSMERLKEVVGGTAFYRKIDGVGKCAGMGACTFGFTIEFYDALFKADDNYIRGTAVHELAHVMDFRLTIERLTTKGNPVSVSRSFLSQGSRPHITKYGDTGYKEYWAEAVTDWVYGKSYNGGETDRGLVDDLQIDYIEGILH